MRVALMVQRPEQLAHALGDSGEISGLLILVRRQIIDLAEATAAGRGFGTPIRQEMCPKPARAGEPIGLRRVSATYPGVLGFECSEKVNSASGTCSRANAVSGFWSRVSLTTRSICSIQPESSPAGISAADASRVMRRRRSSV